MFFWLLSEEESALLQERRAAELGSGCPLERGFYRSVRSVNGVSQQSVSHFALTVDDIKVLEIL